MRRLALPAVIVALTAAGSLSYIEWADGGKRPGAHCERGVCWPAGRWSGRSWHWHVRYLGAEQGRRAERRARLEAEQQLAQARRRLRAVRHDLRRLQARRAEPDWRARQIAAAEVIGRESAGDPWPNCPDPYDGSGASWDDTANCENGGRWHDSPGYYRCGLQFDPDWETRFGRLCP
jgi:hypothetical protein